MEQNTLKKANQLSNQIVEMCKMAEAWELATKFHPSYKLRLINDDYDGNYGVTLNKNYFELIKSLELKKIYQDIEVLEFDLKNL